MIFGRKSKNPEPDDLDDDTGSDLDDLEDAESDAVGQDGGDQDGDEQTDEWATLDASRDWREDGPFDISEVDLDADDIERVDLGSLVLTPFDGMQMQLQVEQETRKVQSALVMQGNSAIEIALFAAPTRGSMLPEIRSEMIEVTRANSGEVTLAEGPFGTEIRRVLPVEGPDGQKMYHVSRTWFAEGPKWMLRGVLMGEAGMATGVDGPTELLYEFFQNVVVRRGHGPMVPGDIIAMNLPDNVVES